MEKKDRERKKVQVKVKMGREKGYNGVRKKERIAAKDVARKICHRKIKFTRQSSVSLAYVSPDSKQSKKGGKWGQKIE